MNAAVFRRFGPPEVLEYETSFPKPTRRRTEVLIRIVAASVNPIDWKTRKGDVPRFAVTRPKIPGGDLAGIVLESDPDSKFKPGDKVFGCIGTQVFWATYGTYAEYAVAAETTLVHIPEGFSFAKAAALPLAAMTAWQALQPAMPLQGKRVLVHAGAGGVGGFAVQIAKAQGAFVATTCGTRNVGFVTKDLGADQAIDYSKEKFEEVTTAPYDCIVDLIGGSYEERSLPLVAKGGHFASVLNSGYFYQLGFARGVPTFIFQTVKNLAKSAIRAGPSYSVVVMRHQADLGLTELAKLMAEGKLKVFIEKEFPLQQAAAAHALSEEGHARGKIIIRVAPEDVAAAAGSS